MFKIKIFEEILEPFYVKAIQDWEDNKSWEENAGFDLFIPEDHLIEPFEICHRIPLGISLAAYSEEGTSENFDMRPRSSLTKLPLIMGNSPATIDIGYRGILEARFHNISGKEVKISAGQRLVQVVRGNLGPIKEIKEKNGKMMEIPASFIVR